MTSVRKEVYNRNEKKKRKNHEITALFHIEKYILTSRAKASSHLERPKNSKPKSKPKQGTTSSLYAPKLSSQPDAQIANPKHTKTVQKPQIL